MKRIEMKITFGSRINFPQTIPHLVIIDSHFDCILDRFDGDNNEFYLTGSEGSSNFVSESDNISGLQKNGIDLTSSELVKFEISPSITGDLIEGSIEFNQNNSTVIDFLNNLPKEIRFIGKAVINEESSGTITLLKGEIRRLKKELAEMANTML